MCRDLQNINWIWLNICKIQIRYRPFSAKYGFVLNVPFMIMFFVVYAVFGAVIPARRGGVGNVLGDAS